MRVDPIKRGFKRDAASKIDLVADGPHRYVVVTPLTYDDGDPLPIVLKQELGQWWLSDEGGSLMHLAYDIDEGDLRTGPRRTIIDGTLEAFALENVEGQLRMRVNGQGFGDALYDFIRALLRIDDIRLLSRERVKSAFYSDFRHLIETTIPEERRSHKWHHPERDPQARYAVDYRVNGRQTPLFLFALPSAERVSIATISVLKLQLWKVPGEPVGIFQDQAKIPGATLARFSDVCPRTFPDLASAAEHLPQAFPDVVRPVLG